MYDTRIHNQNKTNKLLTVQVHRIYFYKPSWLDDRPGEPSWLGGTYGEPSWLGKLY